MKYSQIKQTVAKFSLVTTGVLSLAIFAGAYFGINTQASPVVGFQAGRIMDDAIFTNKDTMTAAQIQAFLEARVPICDTNGTKPSEYGGGTRAEWAAARGYSPPFTCLKDFSEGGKLASQIIYDVSQQFSINPQVLIVLLQKEQSLITDDWPIPGSSQYRTATGYGCPDTAACDSEYFGLTNQLTWSGRMFRAIMNASPTWYTPYVLGNNYVQFNPDASCGGSTVNIQNRSTQALYNYTPYQPNQAALDAGWGQVTCGAYGNRNFFLYFTSWFGPTTLECRPDETPSTEIIRLYNRSTFKHFYTSYDCEAQSLVARSGFKLEGRAFDQTSASSPYAVVVHRLYNPSTFLHLWVTTQEEINSATQLSGYRYEGPAFYAVNPELRRGVVVHRLYNNKTFKHLWVTTQEEINSATQFSGYRYEGPAFWAESTD